MHPERQLRRDDVREWLLHLLCARRRLPHLFPPSAPPHSRASGRHSPTAQLPTHAPPPFLAGYMHFKVHSECLAASSPLDGVYPYASGQGPPSCFDNSGLASGSMADFSQNGQADSSSTCYMRVFSAPSAPSAPSPPSPPSPPSSPPLPPAPVYQALDPSGYKCQGWYVQKNAEYPSSYSAADCQALCTQSAYCGATTFQLPDGYYRNYNYCARDTACPTCSSLSAPAPQPCLLPSLSHRPAAHTRRPPSWQATCTSRTRQSARRP